MEVEETSDDLFRGLNQNRQSEEMRSSFLL